MGSIACMGLEVEFGMGGIIENLHTANIICGKYRELDRIPRVSVEDFIY